MKKKPRPTKSGDELRPEYNFDYSKAVRGKYAQRLLSTSLVTLDPDVAQAFPDSASVNQALRALLNLARVTHRPARNSRARS